MSAFAQQSQLRRGQAYAMPPVPLAWLTRILKELMVAARAPPPWGTSWLELHPDRAHVIVGSLQASDDSPWAGVRYPFEIVLGESFPFGPPRFFFTAPVTHPNVAFLTGEPWVSTLGSDWSPALSLLEKLVISVQSVLSCPCMDGEVAFATANHAAATLYKKNKAELRAQVLAEAKAWGLEVASQHSATGGGGDEGGDGGYDDDLHATTSSPSAASTTGTAAPNTAVAVQQPALATAGVHVGNAADVRADDDPEDYDMLVEELAHEFSQSGWGCAG